MGRGDRLPPPLLNRSNPKPILTARAYLRVHINARRLQNPWTNNRICANFINEVSNFTDEAPASPAKTKSAAPGAIGQVVEIAGSGSQIRIDAAALSALQSHADASVAMSGQVGSQVKMMVGIELADRQRPHAARRRQWRAFRPRRLPRRRHEGFGRQARQLPPRRHPLSDPGLRRASGHDRRPARDLRRKR